MKGPDLLNNLFGILLRFQENEVAISTNVSRMYHRVLIPEQDQDIHWYLWKNLETDQKPDIYVKMVLTFGDKSALAKVQIALQKTAMEGEKNTYMDDIYDSVHSAEQARKLTTEIDEVLSHGGLHVKGWLSNVTLMEDGEITNEIGKLGMRLLQGPVEEKVLGTIWNTL